MRKKVLIVGAGPGGNATEGLAATRTILPMTIFLVGGQVLPFGLLAVHFVLAGQGLIVALLATIFALLPRVIAAGDSGNRSLASCFILLGSSACHSFNGPPC
jgi:hypothetical protein